MQKCPNCGRKTAATRDWACQWCGYPLLLSKSYERMPKTYKQLKEEKLYRQKSPVIREFMPAMEVTVEEVYSAYVLDKVAADARFRNRSLKVTGIVDRKVFDDTYDIYYIILSGAEKEEEWNVICMFDKKNRLEVNRLTEEERVTVEGKYNGYNVDILIKDCVLTS
jgi:ribosomal protein L37E